LVDDTARDSHYWGCGLLPVVAEDSDTVIIPLLPL